MKNKVLKLVSLTLLLSSIFSSHSFAMEHRVDEEFLSDYLVMKETGPSYKVVDGVALTPLFWDTVIEILERVQTTLSPNGKIVETNMQALAKDIVDSAEDKQNLYDDLVFLQRYIIPSISSYHIRSGNEHAAERSLWNYITKYRPFDKRNLIEMWYLMEKVNPLTEQNANAILKTVTSVIFPPELEPVWGIRRDPISDRSYIVNEEETDLDRTRISILSSAFSDDPGLWEAFNSAGRRRSFFTDLLGKYYAFRFYADDTEKRHHLLSDRDFRTKFIDEKMQFEKIRDGFLKKEKLDTLIKELIELLNPNGLRKRKAISE